MSEQLNLSEVRTVDLHDEKFVKEPPLPPLPRAGYNLSRIILYMIAGYIVFLLFLLVFTKFDATDKIDLSSKSIVTDSVLFNHQKDLLIVYQQEKKSYRDFIIQITQMILLNLLLPTLTAILGYIFGSREEARRGRE